MFMDVMERFFRYFLDKFVIVLINDILVYSRNLDEHAHHLITVLQTFSINQLYAKLSKCEIWIDRVVFLGYVIFKDGISVYSSKVKVVSWSCRIL